uniref:Uncharacterized protein n=1 Tax=candidate division CPR3 bacterium TaxID=2268181 RepID=A0A7C5YUP7_UNCC3
MAYFSQYRKGNKNASATLDAGLGLIFRLNTLWRSADLAALRGELEEYNDILNRIFVNLLYKTPMDIEFENNLEKKEIKSVDWNDDDAKIFNKFKEMVREVKKKETEAIKKRNRSAYNSAKEEHYEILLKKDTWLRKFMMEKGLYLKEVEFNPETAMWGGM